MKTKKKEWRERRGSNPNKGNYTLDSPRKPQHRRSRELDEKPSFKEWASNFSEGIFAMLKLYADESGTHDGADVIVISGLIESREYWKSFNRRWQAVLDDYKRPYFHYREFRESANTSPGDPYYGMSKRSRKNFVFRLAMLVGDSAVPVGGGSRTKRIHDLDAKKNPTEEAIRNFFESAIAMLNLHWPEYDGRMLFIFDKCKNSKLAGMLTAIHAEYTEKESRFGGLLFADDKDPCNLALQAADLSTTHFRNGARQYVLSNEGERIDATLIDFIVHKNQDVDFRKLHKKKFEKLVSDIREHEEKQTASWRKQGIKKTYHPLDDFPFAEYGYKK